MDRACCAGLAVREELATICIRCFDRAAAGVEDHDCIDQPDTRIYRDWRCECTCPRKPWNGKRFRVLH